MEYSTSIPKIFFDEFSTIDASFMEQLEKMYNFQDWYKFIDNTDFSNIEQTLQQITPNVDYILSFGTGGSYSGVKALVEFTGNLSQWIFIGSSLDSDEVQEIFEIIQNKKIGVLLISKNGSTMEINIFYNLFKKYLLAAQWVTIITSNSAFADSIEKEINRKAIRIFIEERTGGRYSLLSNLGITILYLLSLDWKALFTVLKEEKKHFIEHFKESSAFLRGVSRYILQERYGVFMEFLAFKDRKLKSFIDCIEQLLAESDGKQNHGLYISKLYYPQDAHSVGQIISDGKRIIAETFFICKNTVNIPTHMTGMQNQPIDIAKLSELFIESLQEDHKNKNILLQQYVIDNNITDLFRVLFSEMLAVSLESYLLGINPFNQPGVDGYKECMKKRLSTI